MSATVLRMSDHRAIFVLPDPAGTVVFMATRARQPRIAHERVFACDSEAQAFALSISTKFSCPVIGLRIDVQGGGKAA